MSQYKLELQHGPDGITTLAYIPIDTPESVQVPTWIIDHIREEYNDTKGSYSGFKVIKNIKLLRNVASLSLKQAKDIVDVIAGKV